MEDKDPKIQALIDALRDTEDFNHLVFPVGWYKKYNIPSVKPMSFKEFMDSGHWYTRHFDPKVEKEIRTEPVEGGVRPVLPAEEIDVQTITKPVDESDADNQQEMPQMSVSSTISNGKENQQS